MLHVGGLLPSYFFHIFFIFLQHLSPIEGGRVGEQISKGPRKFNIYPNGRARNFSKSHGGLRLVGISHIYLHDSPLTSVDWGSYFFISSSYRPHISSLFVSIWTRKEGESSDGFREGEGGGLANFICTSGEELGIFRNLTEAHDCWDSIVKIYVTL